MFEFDERTYQELYDMVGSVEDMTAKVAEVAEDVLNSAPDDDDFEGTMDQEHLEEVASFLRDAASYLEDGARAIGDAMGI